MSSNRSSAERDGGEDLAPTTGAVLDVNSLLGPPRTTVGAGGGGGGGGGGESRQTPSTTSSQGASPCPKAPTGKPPAHIPRHLLEEAALVRKLSPYAATMPTPGHLAAARALSRQGMSSDDDDEEEDEEEDEDEDEDEEDEEAKQGPGSLSEEQSPGEGDRLERQHVSHYKHSHSISGTSCSSNCSSSSSSSSCSSKNNNNNCSGCSSGGDSQHRSNHSSCNSSKKSSVCLEHGEEEDETESPSEVDQRRGSSSSSSSRRKASRERGREEEIIPSSRPRHHRSRSPSAENRRPVGLPTLDLSCEDLAPMSASGTAGSQGGHALEVTGATRHSSGRKPASRTPRREGEEVPEGGGEEPDSAQRRNHKKTKTKGKTAATGAGMTTLGKKSTLSPSEDQTEKEKEKEKERKKKKKLKKKKKKHKQQKNMAKKGISSHTQIIPMMETVEDTGGGGVEGCATEDDSDSQDATGGGRSRQGSMNKASSLSQGDQQYRAQFMAGALPFGMSMASIAYHSPKRNGLPGSPRLLANLPPLEAGGLASGSPLEGSVGAGTDFSLLPSVVRDASATADGEKRVSMMGDGRGLDLGSVPLSPSGEGAPHSPSSLLAVAAAQAAADSQNPGLCEVGAQKDTTVELCAVTPTGIPILVLDPVCAGETNGHSTHPHPTSGESSKFTCSLISQTTLSGTSSCSAVGPPDNEATESDFVDEEEDEEEDDLESGAPPPEARSRISVDEDGNIIEKTQVIFNRQVYNPKLHKKLQKRAAKISKEYSQRGLGGLPCQEPPKSQCLNKEYCGDWCLAGVMFILFILLLYLAEVVVTVLVLENLYTDFPQKRWFGIVLAIVLATGLASGIKSVFRTADSNGQKALLVLTGLTLLEVPRGAFVGLFKYHGRWKKVFGKKPVEKTAHLPALVFFKILHSFAWSMPLGLLMIYVLFREADEDHNVALYCVQSVLSLISMAWAIFYLRPRTDTIQVVNSTLVFCSLFTTHAMRVGLVALWAVSFGWSVFGLLASMWATYVITLFLLDKKFKLRQRHIILAFGELVFAIHHSLHHHKFYKRGDLYFSHWVLSAISTAIHAGCGYWALHNWTEHALSVRWTSVVVLAAATLSELLVFCCGIRMNWKRVKKMLQALFISSLATGVELSILVA